MSELLTAVRAFSEQRKEDEKRTGGRPPPPPRWPRTMLIFDTETTDDETQRLLFGFYRYCRATSGGHYRTVTKGIFYADDLEEFDPQGFQVLKQYAEDHRGQLGSDLNPELGFLPRREFVASQLFRTVQEGPGLIVGFNLPFDLSRIVVAWGKARDDFRGGFSFRFYNHLDTDTGEVLGEDGFKPRTRVKSLDPRRAFMGMTNGREGGQFTHVKQNAWLLDLRTLAFALTSRGHSLRSACEAFDVPHQKLEVDEHGVITPEYIRYCRRDVLASLDLLEALREEFDRHPLELRPYGAFSPASLAKAYLKAMGVSRPMTKFEGVSPEEHGICMQAYFGGRSEVRIRHQGVPVVYVDFLSMYPTVNSLMGLWEYVIADDVEFREATGEVEKLLGEVKLDDLFDPEFWPKLAFFAQVQPEGEVLPLRAQYNPSSQGFTIGVNRVSGEKCLWYSGPDLVASVLLSGKIPKVEQAIWLVPTGVQEGLKSLELRGEIEVDPAEGDFFREVIERRKAVQGDSSRPKEKRERLQTFLKILANAGNYGIYAEMNPQDLPEDATVKVHGHGDPYSHETDSPEDPGKYCFPTFAALTTGAARLMLAMLETCVGELGGTYAFCDTDSMAVVSTREGGRIPCPGGQAGDSEGGEAIHALSWEKIEGLVDRFEQLKPYNPEVVKGPVLEVESENYLDGERRQLYCLAVSAKRYALYTVDEKGGLEEVVKASQHGLGHLLPPTEGSPGGKHWTDAVWTYLIRRKLGEEVEEPEWFDLPAVARTTMSSPQLLEAFEQNGIPYAEQVKPFNFLLSVPVARGWEPEDGEAAHFSLIAPYESDPDRWTDMEWIDKYSGQSYPVSTKFTTSPRVVPVKTFGDVVEEYWSHAEPKSAAPEGGRCGRRTRGLLGRRQVHVLQVQNVGKESNQLDQVDAGLISDWGEVREEYASGDPLWEDHVIPVLKQIPSATLAWETGLSQRTIRALRNGHRGPSPESRTKILQVFREFLDDSFEFRQP